MSEDDTAAPSVEVNAMVSGSVNYAMSHNSVLIMSDLEIVNLTERTFTDVQAVITSSPGFLIRKTIRFDKIDPRGTVKESMHNDSPAGPVRIDAEYILNATERVTGNVKIEVLSDGEIIGSNTFDMTVLAFDEWPGARYSELISAFVTPNDPILGQLRSEASSILVSWGKQGSLEGYQRNDRLRVKEQMAAVYNAVRRLNMNYVNPPASFEERGQRVRSVHDVLNFKEGSCMDLSVLFASVLESVGIDPLMVFVKGHVFVGAWLEPTPSSKILLFDSAEISRKVKEDMICVFECTAATSDNGIDFNTACEMASKRLDPSEFSLAVDIKKARSVILPLPVRKLVDGKWIVEKSRSEIENNVDLRVKQKYEPHKRKEETKIDLWERKLLDTSSRNNLINLRFTKKMIPLMVGDLSKLLTVLTGEKKFKLTPKPQEWTGSKAFEASPHECPRYIENCRDSSIGNLGRNIVDTPLTAAELQSKMVTIFREAKKNTEEIGSASLFAAIGMLKWFEDGDIRYAPLLLVPVSIERQSSVTYSIKADGDDIMLNTTLVEKLRNEYKTDISMDLTDNVDIEEVLGRTLHAIEDMKGWDVINSAVLGIFSFGRIVMWNDLRKFKDKLAENKLVKSLMESKRTWDAAEVNEDSDPYSSDMCLTVPADSSQVRAVKAACNGKTFVLHGPPGTGKSQTITNIISNALYNNKTVLFVAEKTAALEVVAKRLDSIGIGEHCLKLHSNKAHTKEVLAQIKGVINKEVRNTAGSCDERRLNEMRKELNRYAKDLHRTRNCGMSVHDMISEYESLEEEGLYHVPAAGSLINNYSSEKEGKIYDVIQRLIGASKNIDLSPSNPLRIVSLSEMQYDIKDAVKRKIDDLRAADEEVRMISDRFEYLDLPVDPDGKDNISDLLKDIDSIDVSVLNDGSALTQKDLLKVLRSGSEKAKGLIKNLAEPSSDIGNGVPSLLEICSVIRQSCPDMKFRYTGRLTSLKRLTDKADEIAGLYKKIPERMAEVNRAWKIPVWENKNLKADWAAVNNKKWFRGGAIKKFMKMIHPHLADLMVPFESIPDKLSLTDRYKDSVTDLRNAAEEYLSDANRQESDNETAILEKYRREIENIERIMSKYGVDMRSLTEICERIKNERRFITDAMHRYDNRTNMINGLAGILKIDLERTGMDDPEECMKFCSDITPRLNDLPDWVNWNVCCREAKKAEVGSAVKPILEGKDTVKLLPSVMRSVYESLAKREIGNSDSLSRFNDYEFGSMVETFRRNDDMLMRSNKFKLANKLRDGIPSGQSRSPYSGQVRELYILAERQTVRRSIRKIFSQIQDLLPDIFPCMMMSPLSASQYHPPTSAKFDIVVFDEASQIPTEVAIGAVARGKSTVIVGDPRQLPPTSFFETKVGSDDDEDDLDDTESFLEECLGLPLPEAYLEWHYRSKHESLIAFSNREYYGNKMQTFPSPNDLETKVSLRMIGGEYGRGGDRTNRMEAAAIATEVAARLKKNPKQSIGVVAFSKAQQDCVEDALDDLAKTDTKLFDLMYNSAEPVFIKNLETVQGDERDVILFSIGYGRGANGKVSMNFGPINKPGGQKRLNVAVSRAREEMVVFSSISADDISVKPESPDGVKSLRNFIEYAARGGTFAERDRSASSEGIPFRIAQELNKLGYKTHFKVGHSRYYVDLAVVSDKDDKRYALGILCDGASYIGSGEKEGSVRSRSSSEMNERDREFARTDFLKRSGWEIVRVSPVEWFSRRERVIGKIKKILETQGQKDIPKVTKMHENISEPVRETPFEPKIPSATVKNIPDGPSENRESISTHEKTAEQYQRSLRQGMIKMTLDDFESKLPFSIKSRAKNYFEKGLVKYLKDEGNGKWSAIVEGTEDYRVTVRLDSRKIVDSDCNCPFYGRSCKHEVAVYLSIRERLR